ncbi:MAG TPA: hypothetical protein VN829_21110, partial [Dongiaceae bacterium]|nr:hypothetical protein [Dongiaceae bacterium]
MRTTVFPRKWTKLRARFVAHASGCWLAGALCGSLAVSMPTACRGGAPTLALNAVIAKLLEPHSGLPSPPPYPDKAHLLAYRDANGLEHPISRPAAWAKRRADILANMQSVMGPLPAASRAEPLDLRVVSEERLPRFTRQKITFLTEPGDRLPAYLLIPNNLKAKAPAMLCLHQTTPIGKAEPAGLGGSDNLHYAQELAERG